ncbi:PspC domain-containing protein [Massilia consociata]|uniref:PspC domain-containing protein n=1 Tax=Massilia consociata TaxID=760117 RepID=A0ABV6FJB0_9BURK
MISDEIRRLHELHQAGALSDAEFEQAKAKVLASEQVNLNKGTGGYERQVGGFEARLRTLRRSRTDRWLGGVCSGLGVTFGMDAWVWRLIFALLTIMTSGIGAVVYLLLWIFVPEE